MSKVKQKSTGKFKNTELAKICSPVYWFLSKAFYFIIYDKREYTSNQIANWLDREVNWEAKVDYFHYDENTPRGLAACRRHLCEANNVTAVALVGLPELRDIDSPTYTPLYNYADAALVISNGKLSITKPSFAKPQPPLPQFLTVTI